MSEIPSPTDQDTVGLQTLSLNVSYRTGEDDLLEDFYVPCLEQASEYDRAAGFFDSKSLVHAARGISQLVVNRGKMRLVVSPHLSPDDIEVLRDVSEGSSPKEDEIIRESLEEGLSKEQFEDYLKRDRFKCLAWMLEQDLLEIKVAYLSEGEDRNPFSQYHEKIGIFRDDFGNKVAFSGSINETGVAWRDNYESFDVYANWHAAMDLRTSKKESSFEKLWNDEDSRVVVRDLPDAIEVGLQEHSPGTVDGQPDLDMFRDESEKDDSNSEDDISLWPHQETAIERWIGNQHKGILAMATGTGKTRTAIAASNLDADNRVTVIIVPTTPLLNQWKEDINELLEDVNFTVCSGDTDWRADILSIVDPYRLNEQKQINKRQKEIVITTLDTAKRETFRRVIGSIPPERIQIIVDEVHNAGADQASQIFEIDAGRRIGLSATPDRKYDDEGNRKITNYFDDIVFRFSTKDAIENGYLTDYDYYPLVCELYEDEYADYKEYGKKIASLTKQIEQNSGDRSLSSLREDRERAYRDRAKVLKKADNKPDRIGRFLETDHETPAIIFCEDNNQRETIEEQLEKKKKSYSVYVSDMGDAEKANAFYKFEEGYVDYLLAINCLDEGVDVPKCPTAIIVSSTTNERQFIQRRGRVLRINDDKPKAYVYDLIVLPGLGAEKGNDTARNFIIKELERVKVLMEAANNKEQVRMDLKQELDPYGFGHLALI